MKIVKWLGIIVGILIVLAVAAALILPSVISTDTIKDRVIAQVRSATGRDLRIDGPVRLAVLPHLAIEANQVSLSNAPGAQAKAMVSLDKLQVNLALLPILSGTIAIDQFVLNKPVISLEVDKQGRPNWNFTAEPGAQANATQAATPSAPSGGGTSLPAGLQLGDVRIVDGSLVYIDDQKGTKTAIDAVNLKLSLPDFDSPFTMKGSADYRGKTITLTAGVTKPRDLTEQQGTAVQAHVDSDVVKFDFGGTAALTATPTASGDIDLSVPSVRQLMAWAGTPMAQEGEGFGPLSIKGKLGMKGHAIQFSNAQISFDAIKGNGQFGVDTGGAKPALSGELALDNLDVNPYLPQPAKGGSSAAAPAAAPAKAGWSDEPIDFSGLNTANVDFKLSANAILVHKIKIDKSVLDVLLKDGRLSANLNDFEAYQGKGTLVVSVDGSGAEPSLSITGNFADVAVEPLLTDAIDLDRLSGKGNLDLSVASHGKSQHAIVNALNGKGSFHLNNGEIKGLDLLKLLNAAANVVGNVVNLATGSGSGNTTQFTAMSATYTITNGVVKNNDLDLEGPQLKAAGAGTIDLPQRQVDYKVTPKVAGLGVPVDITGPWDDLSYRPDLAGMVKGGIGGAANTVKGLVPGMGGSSSGSKSGSGGLFSNPFK